MTMLAAPSDLSIHYRDQGSGLALLLFNGATLPLEFWNPLADRLHRNYRVIRFDQRNAGGTVFNGTFTLNDTAADAARVLDELKVESATLIGHAWGGRAAQVFARDYPHRTDAMVICGTGGQLPATVDPEVLQAMRQAMREGRREDWEKGLAITYCAAGFPDQAPDRFQEISDLLWLQKPAGKARWDAQVSPSVSYWGQSKRPTLLVYGVEDKNGTPENAKNLQATLADARLEFIDQAAHFVIREAPERTSELIENFLSDTLEHDIHD